MRHFIRYLIVYIINNYDQYFCESNLNENCKHDSKDISTILNGIWILNKLEIGIFDIEKSNFTENFKK